MKYSDNFNRDFNFYLKSRNVFTFCGTADFESGFIFQFDRNGLSAKEALYHIESHGRKAFEIKKNKYATEQAIVKTRHPLLCKRLFLAKSGVNFMIKQWAEGRVDGTLPLIELSKRRCIENKFKPWQLSDIRFRKEIKNYYKFIDQIETVAYRRVKNHLFIDRFRDMEHQYSFPAWVINAVENQKMKLWKIKREADENLPSNAD